MLSIAVSTVSHGSTGLAHSWRRYCQACLRMLRIRVALVVGNNARKVSRLEKAINDAKAVSTSLQAIGFQVQLATELEPP